MKPPKVLTNGELFALNTRIRELDNTISECGGECDPDVLDNLRTELDEIIQILESSSKLAKIRESGLKIVGAK